MTLPDNVRHLVIPGPTDLVPVDDELEPAPEVLEAELVDEPAPAVVQPAERRPIPVWSQRLPAPVQRAAASRTAEHVAIAATGVASWSGRAVDGATLGTIRRQIRAAEQDKDREALAEWLDRRREIAAARHTRWLALPKLAGSAIAAVVLALAAGLFLLVVVAVLAKVSHVASFTGVLRGAARLVAVLLWAAASAWRCSRWPRRCCCSCSPTGRGCAARI
jgi:hypothetical protein